MPKTSTVTASSWTLIEEKTVRFKGVMPDVIYRYRPLKADTFEELIRFEIIEEAVFLAGMGQLNDPDEGRIRWIFDGSKEDIYKYWKKKISDENTGATRNERRKEAQDRTKIIFHENKIVRPSIVSEFHSVIDSLARVTCFTTDPINKAMWSHYGKWIESSGDVKEHGGICIEYECGEALRNAGLRPVTYSQDRPTVNVIATYQEKISQVDKGLFIKDPCWSYENEWRVVSFIEAKPPFPDYLTQNSKWRFVNGVKAVIFGLNATDKIIQVIDSILKEHNRQVPLKKVYRHPTTQELYIDSI